MFLSFFPRINLKEYKGSEFLSFGEIIQGKNWFQLRRKVYVGKWNGMDIQTV
jgi:hypothetical protein